MKTYKRIYGTWGDGSKCLERYQCNENPKITIEIEYGFGSRASGYTIKYDGSADLTRNISHQSLKEAKEWADYYFKD